MGMDVSGRKPDSPAGTYFRANVWSWRPIHALMAELCSDILDEELLDAMSFNDGAGPEHQEVCTQMAIRFENWMERHIAGHALHDTDLRVTVEGRFVSEEEINLNPDLETQSAYSVEDDHLKEWIEFLRHCGGFKVD